MANSKLLGSVKGSSLIEVITAMIIAGIIFSIAITIYLNVITTSFSLQSSMAANYIQELVINLKASKDFKSEKFYFDNIVVYQTVKPYHHSEQLILVTWEARDSSNKLRAERKCIFYATDF